MIKQRTGHRSLESLCQFECTFETQLLDISNVVSCGQNSDQRKMPLVAKSQQSVAADIVPYDKDPRSHQMLSVTQSTSFAASANSKEPQSTFFSTAVIFHHVLLCLLEVLIVICKVQGNLMM